MGGVRVLTLSDFDALSVDSLARIAAALPRIECLQLHYCNLTHELSQAPPFLTQTLPQVASSSFMNTKRLSFCWTDFTQQAVACLLAKLPYLESVDLGANRNRVIGANTAAVQSLADHCPNVNELTISLQQVSESVLCDTIEHYGRQLHTLSIRCDGRDTLKSVAHHATHVKNLTIRASAQHQPSSTNPIVGILQRCKELVHLEMVSWMVQDVPTVVWRGIDAVAVRRRRAGPWAGKKKLPSKTLALDLEELQEIRKQFVNRTLPLE
ncbi:hypothetical protein BJV82DRAFT_519251 [Fennellomyces sp. T-0311]|nr:hypothetical protein BJV82DRAFT_519251 [Fennellomyces sp. T-0311]